MLNRYCNRRTALVSCLLSYRFSGVYAARTVQTECNGTCYNSCVPSVASDQRSSGRALAVSQPLAAKVQLLFQLTIRFVEFNMKSLSGEYDVLRLQVAMSYSERVNIGFHIFKVFVKMLGIIIAFLYLSSINSYFRLDIAAARTAQATVTVVVLQFVRLSTHR